MTEDPDFTWLVEHDQELSEQYPGKWVAIWRGRVIAVGENILDAAKKADLIAPPDEYIMHAVSTDVDVIYAQVRLG